MPSFNDFPDNECPNGPGNISGKSVKTVACQHGKALGATVFWFKLGVIFAISPILSQFANQWQAQPF
jgi:hypothetical protein